jgi:hypothetical protein
MIVRPMSDFNRAVQAGVAGFALRRAMRQNPGSALWQDRYQQARARYAALTAHMTTAERQAVAAKARDNASRWGITDRA